MDYHNKFLKECNKLPNYCIAFFNSKTEKYSEQTKYAYAMDLKVFFEWVKDLRELDDTLNVTCDILDALTDDDINSFLAYLTEYEYEGKIYHNSSRGKMRKLGTLRALFKYLLNKKYIFHNPLVLVETPKIRGKEIIILTEEEQEKLFDVAENGTNKKKRAKLFHEKIVKRDIAILTLFLGTGIRVSELVRIDEMDIDFDEKRIFITRKGGSEQFVYFGDEVAAALLEYIEEERPRLLGYTSIADVPPEAPLFVSLKHQRISTRMVEIIIKNYAKAVVPGSVNITPHALRRTFGTMLYYQYKDIYLTQKALGHTSPQTTIKYYTKFDDEQLKKLKNYNPSSLNSK